jgi:hypothetical protein
MERGRVGLWSAAAGALLLLLGGCANPLLDTVKQIVDNAAAPKAPVIVLMQDVIKLSSGGVYDCGSIMQATNKDITFTISNTGSGDLRLSNIPPVVVSGGDFSVTQQPNGTVAAGGSTTFVVRFSPATTGSKTGTLYVPSSDSSAGTITVTLLGTATTSAQPAIQLRMGGTVLASGTGTYDFGNVLYNTSGSPVTFSIDNIGSAALTLNATPVSRGGTNPGMYSNTQPSPLSVAAGTTVTFTGTFSPTTNGSLGATISVGSNDPVTPTYTFNVTGTGTAPEINVKQGSTSIASGGSYDFGGVRTTSNVIVAFTVENVAPGNGTLVITTPVTSTDATRFYVDAQPATSVAVGGSTTFKIKFSPGSPGVKTAVISVTNNDQNENPYTFTVTGTGADAAYVSPSGAAGNSGLLGTSAKNTVADGIAVAQAYGLTEVRIALGTYTISSTVNVVAGISLKGGYASDFSTRSYSNISKLSLASFITGITADGAAITRSTVIDGLTVEAASLGGLGAVFVNSASPTFSNNTVKIIDTVADGSYVIGIEVAYTSGNVGNPILSGNTVILNHPNGTTDDRTRAIYVSSAASGSDVVIERNVISAQSNYRTDGIRVASSAGVTIRNNIVSVKCTGSGMTMPVIADLSTVIVANNTMSSHSVSGSQYGFYAGSSTTAVVMNNIFGSPRNSGYALLRNSTTTFGWNLAFNFTTLGSGGTDLGNNVLNATDLFTSVFTGARDTDLSDGDQSNYHLTDSGTYAYNLGTNTNTTAYGLVANDMDGEARPKGGLFDKGADEK